MMSRSIKSDTSTINATATVVFTLLSLLLGGCHAKHPPMMALRDVNVVDVTDGTVRADQIILIEGNRIVEVGAAEGFSIPDAATEVDAAGSYVIPGLWDMHTHHFRSSDGLMAEMARHLSDGVLGVRDMGIPLDSIARLREVATSPSGSAPRVWFTGPLLEETEIYAAYSARMAVLDTMAARQAVDRLAAAGVTAIKVHDLLSPEMHGFISRAASDAGLPVVGHVPVTMTVDQVIDARQRSIEHLGQHNGLFAACSAGAPIDPQTSARLLTDQRYFAYFLSEDYLAPLLSSFDADLCADLAMRLADAEVWQVPTLVVWKEWADGAPWIPSDIEVYLRASLTTAMRITAILNGAGVPIMAGTDNVDTIHDELALLVEAGLTPLEALQTATSNPARFVGRIDDLGTVEPGKLADLVLLDGNPLDEIANTRTIRGVVADGRYYGKADLDSLGAEPHATLTEP